MAKKNKQWEQMVEILCASNARCMWQKDIRDVAMVECWMVYGLPVIFTAYHHAGGFDVYTPHQSPREIPEILPWIRKAAIQANQ